MSKILFSLAVPGKVRISEMPLTLAEIRRLSEARNPVEAEHRVQLKAKREAEMSERLRKIGVE